MAEEVAGDMYYSLTGQLLEINRQLRQPGGYPFDPLALKAHLQEAIEGRLVRPKGLLQLAATVSVSAFRTFKAAECFQIRSHVFVVKIGWLGDNFKKHFLGLIEDACEATEIKVSRLLEPVFYVSLQEALSTGAYEIRLGQLLALLERQGRGEPGPLLTNGYANVAFIRDVNGVVWGVRAFWDGERDDCAWRIEAESLRHRGIIRAGSQVLSL